MFLLGDLPPDDFSFLLEQQNMVLIGDESVVERLPLHAICRGMTAVPVSSEGCQSIIPLLIRILRRMTA